MLTFVKDKSATEVVGIYSKSNRSAKPEHTVYYTHDGHADKGNVAPAAGVLALHKDALKKIHKLSDTSFDTICGMLDSGEEPEIGDPHRSEYWEVKKKFENALRNEVYLGDQTDLYFEHNLPRDKNTWGGTFTAIGNSGAGKTYWVVQLLMRYLRATKPHSRRTIIWASPEYKIDRSLLPLKAKSYAFNVIGIDVSQQELKKSGMDSASFFKTNIEDVIEQHGDHAVIVLDDFMDAAAGLTQPLRHMYNNLLRTARHKVTSVVSLVHSYASGKFTSTAIQSNKFLVFFARSQKNRVVMFCRDHLHMSVPEAKELVQRFAKLDRWLVIRMHSPVAMYNSKYLLLL